MHSFGIGKHPLETASEACSGVLQSNTKIDGQSTLGQRRFAVAWTNHMNHEMDLQRHFMFELLDPVWPRERSNIITFSKATCSGHSRNCANRILTKVGGATYICIFSLKYRHAVRSAVQTQVVTGLPAVCHICHLFDDPVSSVPPSLHLMSGLGEDAVALPGVMEMLPWQTVLFFSY